jgi:hypothetical protein
MKAFKAFFLSRLMREKALLLAFVGIGAVIWLSSFVGRARTFARGFRQTTQELAEQRQVLDSRQSVEAAAKKAIAQFEPKKTYSDTSLNAKIKEIADTASLKYTIEPSRDEPTPQFVMHSVRFQTSVPKDNQNFLKLRTFYLELGKQSPYISIEQCTMSVSAATVTAVFKLSAVEIASQK